MKKFEGILLISDFDGTLSHGGTISRENCDAIRYFQENGGLFTVASGRQLGWMKEWRHLIVANTWLSLINGALICDPEEKEIAFCEYAGRELLERSTGIFEDFPNIPFAFHYLEGGEVYRQNRDDPFPTELLERPIYKTLYRVSGEDSEAYSEGIRRALAPDFIARRSWLHGIEIMRRGLDKGSSLQRIRRLLGDSVRLTVAVGNYENDIDLLEAADIGYAVEDSIPSLLAVADRVTVRCADHAIAAVISDLEREFANS